MVKNNPNKELEYKLRQQLNNFNPEEVESYLEVLLRKCLEATVEKDYLALGSVEDILNKSIVILSSKVKNFSLMYSNVKLKVATDYLAKYIEVDNAEAFKFFNVLPEFIEEEPSNISIETKKEMLTEVYYITEHIERAYNYLHLLLDYLYMLTYGIEGTEIAGKIEASFSHLIELAYTKLEESFKELDKYTFKKESLETDLILSDGEEKEVTFNLLFYLDSIQEFKEKLEKLKVNPFHDVANYLVLDWIALVFGLREPLESVDSFRETLTEEGDIAVLNCLIEGFTTNLATYDFNNFKIIPPKEIEVDPEEPEIKTSKEFREAEVEYLENLPEWLKDRFNITEEKIEAKKEKLLKEKNSSEENVPEEEDLPTNEDSSENDVPINEA